MEKRSRQRVRDQVAHLAFGAETRMRSNARGLSMMARSSGSINRPDTEAQDQPSPNHHFRLATRGRSIQMGHVWTAPSWQELSSRLQHWSVQPCVRPFDAAHMTAGHNALRGSGPDQQLAFKNAMAHVGYPDRRIDRLCITCCSPSPTFTSRRFSDAISFIAQARRVPCIARPWPSWPRPFGRSCWRAR